MHKINNQEIGVIDPQITAIVGQKAQGKSSVLINIIENYKKQCEKVGRTFCCLIDCATDSEAFTNYETISLEELQNLPSIYQAETPFEGVLVVPFDADYDYQKRLSIIYGASFNCYLILDEAGTWFTPNLKASYQKIFAEHRNRGIELYFNCHGLTEIPKKVRKHVNRIIYFITGEYFPDFNSFARLGFPYPVQLWDVVNAVNGTPQKNKLPDRPTIQPYSIWDKSKYVVYEDDSNTKKVGKKTTKKVEKPSVRAKKKQIVEFLKKK